MSEHELLALTECGLGQHGLYIYDFDTASAFVARAGEVAWPVEYLLAKHHRKHVFVPRKPPHLSEVGRALRNWEAKVRWRYYFWRYPSENPWRFFISKGRDTTWCSTPIPNFLQAYIDECKSKVFSSCRAARSRFFCCRHKLSNLNGVCRLGLDILSKGEWGACKTDKDGGFVLVRKHDIVRLCLNNMGSEHYEPAIFDDEVNAFVGQQYLQAVRLVADAVGDKNLEGVLLSDYRRGRGRAKSFLDITIKTHKDAGEVVPRPIHTSAQHPFAPGMRWLSQELRKSLDLPHLLRDTQSLIHRLSTHTIPHDHVLVKIDIKDFFMSGHLSDLVEICSQYFEPAVREAGRNMLRTVLYNQYISIPGHDGTWCTVQGSGMGLIPSGDISDLCFYHMVDKFLLQPSSISEYNISLFARYKDDAILTLGGSSPSRLRLYSRMKSLARFFKIKIESIHHKEAQMLDLTVFKGMRWRKTGLLDYVCFVKPTSQQIPLSCRSGHAWNVHVSWPFSQLARFERNCSNKSDASNFKEAFRAALSRSGFNLVPDNQATRSTSRLHSSSGPRLILPFRPDWGNASVCRILRNVWIDWQATFLYEGFPLHASTVAWKAGFPSLATTVRRMNGYRHEQHAQYSAVFM